MKISNLRIERKNGLSYLVMDVECKFSSENKLWFSVPSEFEDMLTSDVCDAFLVASIFPAMYYNEPIEVEGLVCKELYHNIVNYVMAIVKDFAPAFHQVGVKVGGFGKAEKAEHLHVGTGFSGGIDSFSTLADRFENTDDPDYKIDTLFFFHVGQYGNVNNPLTWERANNRFGITRDFASEIGVTALMMNTNLFDFYLPEWEYKAGVLNRIASVLVFQKSLKRYYISNTYTYGEMIDLAHDRVFLEEFADPYIMPLLSPDGLKIVCDGAQYRRTTKTLRIADNALAQRHLNVCVNSSDAHTGAMNCGHCSKCLRTMMTLDSLDELEKFRRVFNLKDWQKQAFGYKCLQICLYKKDGFARDNVDFARERGKWLPPVVVAWCYVYAGKLFALPRRVWRRLKKMF